MDPQDPPSSWRLPGPGKPLPEWQAGSDEARARSRDRGLRQVRRLSNWTAVALVAATAVTAGYFARGHAGYQASSVVASHSQAPASSSGRPCVTVPVAVSGGSGVTTAAPAQSCAPGTGGGAAPRVIYVSSGEHGGD
jgi:hypothetical protein